jgi:hypothetical protein
MPPKLVGILGTFYTNLHPASLLLATTLLEAARNAADAIADELEIIGRDSLEALLPASRERSTDVRTCMQNALDSSARPTTLRAYLPDGPRFVPAVDPALAELWCSRAQLVLAESAAADVRERRRQVSGPDTNL